MIPKKKFGETLLNSLKPFMDFIAAHPETIPIVTDALLALAGAFVLVKSVALISDVMALASAAIAGVGTAATVTTGAISTMAATAAIPITVVVAGAIADLYLLKKAADAVKGAFDDVSNAAQAAHNLGNDAQVIQLQKQAAAYRAIGAPVPASIINAIASLSGGRAAGGPISAGQAYLVGERGPEIVVPNQNSNVIPNNKLGMASTININVNAGALMGTDVEARKFANVIFEHLKDLAGSKNMSVSQMIGM
jgi:hypothetical protein